MEGLAPLPVHLPAGLTAVPLTGVPPSDLVIAWSRDRSTPLVRSFVRIATALLGRSQVTAVGGLHA
ncbi:hypothetical protein [Streptomyces sp. NPDC020298]|uniref:hypothetical protein n=1 Tax=unclassified Streptomyces TaxID=2593676 RepID=UPI003405FDAA